MPLRKNAVWSDGTPITADDVVFTVSAEMDAHLDTRAHFQWNAVRAVSRIDDHTVRFRVATADASFVADHLVFPIVPKRVYGQLDLAHMSKASASDRPLSGSRMRPVAVPRCQPSGIVQAS